MVVVISMLGVMTFNGGSNPMCNIKTGVTALQEVLYLSDDLYTGQIKLEDEPSKSSTSVYFVYWS
jgi:hypothetical protein